MASFREAYTQAIVDALSSGTTVVLPSELAAEFWRREPLRLGIVRVVREDRIISWDRFKEQAFDLRTERLPANRTLRALFVDRLLAEHARAPFFSRLIPPASAHAPEGFRASITRALPALPQARTLERLVGEHGAAGTTGSVARESGPYAPLLADLRELERRYTAFLEEHRLYEPAWLERAPAYRGGDHLLVMPELAEDFPEFEHALVGLPRVSLSRRAVLPDLAHYTDSRAEIDAVLGSVAALLDAGTPPESIVITACDLERLRTRIEQAAELAAIPLSIRQGVPLSGSAPGRFLASMADVVSSGFSLEALKGFLLNRAVPWRGFERNANLILRGAAHGCLGGQGRPDPRWRRLADSPERELIDLLAAELPAIVRARSAADLRTRLFRFLSRLIDRDAWSEENERLLQRSLEELRTLSEFEETHGLVIDEPYRFWMDRLAEQLYVPRSGERGVSVLPYRVGAGLCPEHHFVVGATNAATRVAITRFPFLTEAERERLGDEVADRDLSERFAAAYAVSGVNVAVSASRLTWDGPALPPSEYVAAARIVPVEPAISPWLAWRAEERFDETATRVYRLQQEGAAAYVAGVRAPVGGGSAAAGLDLTQEPLRDPELIRAAFAAQRHRRRPELVSLSAADIDRFRACPFGYLLSRVLGLRDLDFSVDPDSPRDFGTLYHNTLEAFFRELHDAGERFNPDPEALERYRTRLREILREQSARARGMVPSFVYAAIEPLAERVFKRLLEHDARLIAGHEITFVEAWEQQIDAEAGVYLVGRIDRVTRDQNGDAMIVDYKKRRVPSGKSQSLESVTPTGIAALSRADRAGERDRLGSVQIPFYIRLLEASGEHVGAAAYYSLEEGTAQLVVSEEPTHGKTVMERERMDEIILLVDDIVRDSTQRLLAGDYRCGDECAGCDFRGVCRTRFVVRDA